MHSVITIAVRSFDDQFEFCSETCLLIPPFSLLFPGAVEFLWNLTQCVLNVKEVWN